MTQIFNQNGQLYGDAVMVSSTQNRTGTFFSTVQSKSSNYSVTIDDLGTTITNTAALTLTLPQGSTVPNGFWFQVQSDITTGSVAALTITRSGSDTIDRAISLVLAAGGIGCILVNNGGTSWYCIGLPARDTGEGCLIRAADLGSGSRVYGPVNLTPSSSATFTPTLSTAYMVPFFFPRSTTLATFSIEVTTLAASNTIRCGLYAPEFKNSTDTTNGGSYPYRLLIDCGTVSSASTGVKTIACAITVQGLVWATIASQAGTSATLRGATAFYHTALPRISTISSTTVYSGFNVSAAGAFASTVSPAVDSSATPASIILY
jgi:hypothetical protein